MKSVFIALIVASRKAPSDYYPPYPEEVVRCWPSLLINRHEADAARNQPYRHLGPARKQLQP